MILEALLLELLDACRTPTLDGRSRTPGQERYRCGGHVVRHADTIDDCGPVIAAPDVVPQRLETEPDTRALEPGLYVQALGVVQIHRIPPRVAVIVDVATVELNGVLTHEPGGGWVVIARAVIVEADLRIP